jgi:hypothetical protein
MLIKFLELYNYQRLKNKGINRITIRFNEVVQVILGKNGSGKSSLVRELSPLPPANDEYDKGGYKHIVIEHKGAEYELYSTPGSPSRHSFKIKRDGHEIELNESMTMNAQSILVKEHFGYTKEIHELLLGMVNGVAFTSMTPQKRREWFTMLHPTDMSFVTELHQILKTILRDTKGGIKTGNSHLADLYGQRKDGMDINGQQQQLDQIQSRRDRIAQFVSHEISGINFQQQIDDDVVTLRQMGEQFQRQPLALSQHYGSRGVILTQLEQCRGELSTLQYARTTHSNELSELAKNEMFSSGNVEKDKADLETSRVLVSNLIEQSNAAYQDAVNRMGDNPLWQKMSQMPFESVRTLLSQLEQLIDYLLRMEVLEDRSVTITQFDKVRRLQYDLTSTVENLEQEDNKLTHRLNHFTNADKTECPSCHHRWIPGISEEQMKQVQTQHAGVNTELVSARDRLAKCVAYITIYDNWYQNAMVYLRYADSFPECREVFDWLRANDVLYEGNRQFANILPAIKHGILARESHDSDVQRLAQIDSKLKLFTNDAIEWWQRRHDEHEAALSKTITQIQRVQQEIARLEKDLRLADDAVIATEVLQTTMQRIKDNTGMLSKQAIANAANTEYHELGEQHKAINAGLYNARSLEGTISSTESHLTSLNASEKALQLLVKATSPTEGIVAEELSEFIGTFIDEMNAIIEEIWGDTLRVLPCNMENGDLSFKFPLISGEFEGGAKDISDSSTGEAQIINYVFRLVVMSYLGFEQYPLHMDEAGANFDVAHRPALMNYIKRAAESGTYSQIFLISHYIANHGVLTHAETCALTTDGVALPEHYNDHVEIE